MKTATDLVRGWLAKGDSDLADAARCANSSGPYDTGYFHCQQAVEKCFKAVLYFHGQVPLNTHDLGRLASAVETLEPSLQAGRTEVLALTDYAVRLRYDADFWPTQRELTEALTIARQVRVDIFVIVPANMHPLSSPP